MSTSGLLLIHDASNAGAWCEDWAHRMRDDGSTVVVVQTRASADRVALAELETKLAQLAADPSVDARRIAAIGFGRGGTLAFQLGCTSRRVKAVANVMGPVLYKSLDAERPIQPLELALNLDVPLFAAFGGRDDHTPTEHVALLRNMLDSAMKNVTYALYPEAAARFYDPANPNFRADDTRDLWQRLQAFASAAFD